MKQLLALVLLAAPLDDMTLGPVTKTAFRGCDAPTPVQAPDGSIYSNVSDCSPAGARISTGWVELQPSPHFVVSSLTTKGSGASGKKLASALVDGSTLDVIERNLTPSGGLRIGKSASVSKPSVTWTGTLDFGWGSFAQASPDSYQYVYLRDSKTAYGSADQVDLARVSKGQVSSMSAWQVYSNGTWQAWSQLASRTAVLSDPGHVSRPYVSYLNQCWIMAVTMPSSTAPGSGLAVYTSLNPEGPWSRRYYRTGVDLGESAQFSSLYPGTILLTEGDHFEWHSYSMPAGC